MVIKDHMPALRKSLAALTVHRVLVGVPAEKALRKPEDGEKDPPNNAAIGYWMENGVPEANIPARPWLGPGIATVQKDINARFEACAKGVLDGLPVSVDRTLNIVGLMAQNAVKSKIDNGPFIPLSPRTLAARRRRGRKGDKPLIDTGQLRASVTYVIRDAGSLSR